jgi:hypothetical protein
MSDNKLRDALKNIASVTKSELYDRPSYWGEKMIVEAEAALRESPAAPEGGEKCTCDIADIIHDAVNIEHDLVRNVTCPLHASPSLPAKEERCVCGKLKKYHFVTQPLACDVYRPAPQPAATGDVSELAVLKAITEKTIDDIEYLKQWAAQDHTGLTIGQVTDGVMNMCDDIIREFHAKVKP